MFSEDTHTDGGTAVLELTDVGVAMRRLDDLLDLSNVKRKLAHAEEGPGLDQSTIDLMEAEYRKFLALHLIHPLDAIVPCGAVDQMWHRHILDTAAYRADCDAIFGQFLDHFPYFGMRGGDDAQALADAYTDTLQHYRDAFGEPPVGTWISSDASKCSRTNCKPQSCR